MSNRFENVNVGVNQERMLRARVRSILDWANEYEEIARENGKEPTLDGFKQYLSDLLK